MDPTSFLPLAAAVSLTQPLTDAYALPSTVAVVHALLGLEEGGESQGICVQPPHAFMHRFLPSFLPSCLSYSSAGTTLGYYTIYAQGREPTNVRARTPLGHPTRPWPRPRSSPLHTSVRARSKAQNLKLLHEEAVRAVGCIAFLEKTRLSLRVFKRYRDAPNCK